MSYLFWNDAVKAVSHLTLDEINLEVIATALGLEPTDILDQLKLNRDQFHVIAGFTVKAKESRRRRKVDGVILEQDEALLLKAAYSEIKSRGFVGFSAYETCTKAGVPYATVNLRLKGNSVTVI